MTSLLLRFIPSLAPFLANPWLIVAFLAYSVAITGFAGFQGYRLGENELYKYIASQAGETIRFMTRVVTLTKEVEVVRVKREIEIQKQFVYLNSEANNVPVRTACNITAGWMRVHDAAAEGSDRRIEGRVDDPADTGITEAAAVQTVAGNYKAFHETANDLNACRAFVRGLGQITGP